MGLEATMPVDNILTTQVQAVINWARRSAVWPMPFATACCGIELMATAMSRYDLSRFGARSSSVQSTTGRLDDCGQSNLHQDAAGHAPDLQPNV